MKSMLFGKRDEHPYTIFSFDLRSKMFFDGLSSTDEHSKAIFLANNFLATVSTNFSNINISKATYVSLTMIEIRDLQNNKIVCKKSIPDLKIRDIVISENCRFVGVNGDSRFLFYEIKNGSLVEKSKFIPKTNPISGDIEKIYFPISISNDGKWMLCCGQETYEYVIWSTTSWSVVSRFTIEEMKLNKFRYRQEGEGSTCSGKFTTDSKIYLGLNRFDQNGDIHSITCIIDFDKNGKISNKPKVNVKKLENLIDYEFNFFTSYNGVTYYLSDKNGKIFIHRNGIKLFSYGTRRDFGHLIVSNDKYILNYYNDSYKIIGNVMKIPS